MGALAMSFGLMPVGALFVVAVAQQVGAPWAVTAGALSSSVGLALIALRYPELNRL